MRAVFAGILLALAGGLAACAQPDPVVIEPGPDLREQIIAESKTRGEELLPPAPTNQATVTVSKSVDATAESKRRAAEQGTADELFALARMYHIGGGVPIDLEEAVNWYRRAAEQNHVEAQFILGVMYNEGVGIPKNYAEAAKWFLRAAEQGDTNAQFQLFALYGAGFGVTKNLKESYIWISIAAAGGHSGALDFRDEAALWLSLADLADAQEEAARRHAEIQRKRGERAESNTD